MTPRPADDWPGARVGVRFDKPSGASQAALDRYVFAQLARRARAKRPLDDTGGGAERRLAPRLELMGNEKLTVTLIPARPVSALASKLGRDNVTPPAVDLDGPPRSFAMCDLSTSGCSFFCGEPWLLRPKQRLRLRIAGPELDIEVDARVIHLRRAESCRDRG